MQKGKKQKITTIEKDRAFQICGGEDKIRGESNQWAQEEKNTFCNSLSTSNPRKSGEKRK